MDNDHDPWRRGIYRSNAQRLSISLAPLVAQRSLLFRIKADLGGAGKESYSEDSLMTPMKLDSEDSVETPSPLLSYSATKPSGLSIPSALSTTSIYSQDSWRPPASSSVSTVPPGAVTTSSLGVPVGGQRNAMTFSPSVQWSDFSSPSLTSGDLHLSDGVYHRKTVSSSSRLTTNSTTGKTAGESNNGVKERVAIRSTRLVDEPKPVIGVSDSEESAVLSMDNISHEVREKDPATSSLVLPGTDSEPQDSPRRTKSKGTTLKVSKSSGLSKVFSRLSKSSSSTVTQAKSDAEDANSTLPLPRPAVHLSSLRLPEIQLSPIKLGFDIPSLEEEKKPELEHLSPPSVPSILPSIPAAGPAPPSHPPIMPPASHTQPTNPPRPTRPGSTQPHKRTTSFPSPCLPLPRRINRRWNPAEMPPLPPMPAFLSKANIQSEEPTDRVATPTVHPRPRPPRATRPTHNRLTFHAQLHSHSHSHPETNVEENDHSLYSPLRRKAERWEEIIASSPVPSSARPRGMSVSGYSMGMNERCGP